MIHPEDLTRTLFERWSLSFEEMAASLQDSFSSDCVWDQRPMAPRTHGPAQAVRFLRVARAGLGLETADVEMLSVATGLDGSVSRVHTERIDHLRRADRSVIVSVPVAGVLHWRDDRIVAWREYFDVASVAGHAVPRLAARGLTRGWTTLAAAGRKVLRPAGIADRPSSQIS